MNRRITAAAITAALALTALSGCNWESRTERCTAAGNTVTSEREYDRKKKKIVTEYECVTPQGEEVDEWKA